MFYLLLLNSFVSYFKYDFVEFALYNCIILFSLSTHTTYFLQPLNVICFQLFKHYYAEAINNTIYREDTQFLKIKFLIVFKDFYRQAFKELTILLAFRKTGIVSYNSLRVIGPL
jgi:DDE superfamily endonuclease